MSEYRPLVRITPLPCGVHDANTGYKINSLVMAPNGAAAYLSVQEVPAGTELTNDEYWIVHTDISPALDTLTDAVESAQSALTKVTAIADFDELFRLSEGHFYGIVPGADHIIDTYKNDGDTEETITKRITTDPVYGSDFIACPKRLFLKFTNTDKALFLYFYTLDNGVYKPNWGIFGANAKTSSGVMNYFRGFNIPKTVIDLPENTYMQVSIDNNTPGEVLFYGWDGEVFGPAVCGDLTVTTANGKSTGVLQTAANNAGGGIVIPGDCRAIVCRGNSYVGAIWGVKSKPDFTTETPITHDVLNAGRVQYFVFPEKHEYKYFMMRFFPDFDIVNSAANVKATVTGDIRDYVCVVREIDSVQLPAARVLHAIETGRKLCDIEWTPTDNIYVTGSNELAFKQGVTYNGLPYGSGYDKAHFVGWHVGLRTFLSAVNDPKSIMYRERVGEGNGAPYYGTVCSAFADMVAGFPVPVTNVGYLYDPEVAWNVTDMPPIGAVWSNIYDFFSGGTHCVVPAQIDHHGENCAVSAFEAAKPIALCSTRYSEIGDEDMVETYPLASGKHYYDDYGVAAYYVGWHADDGVPYLNFDDMEVVNGSARPYKGDQSVYTSEEIVRINIKSGNYLYVVPKNGNPFDPIKIDGEFVDINKELLTDGIYYVYTDTDSKRESFEYKKVTPIRWNVSNSNIVFDKNDFWYAQCHVIGHPLLKDADGKDRLSGAHTPVLCNDNYSRWFKDGKRIANVMTIFSKGEYGAYVIPNILDTSLVVPAGEGGGGGGTGADGASAYEIAVKNGFTGTEAEWLASLKGDPGGSLSVDENGNATISGVFTVDTDGNATI